MKKSCLLITFFVLLTSIAFTQTKQFATKQEAEDFIVETIKKTVAAPFKFDSYERGVLTVKNPKVEKIEDDDVNEKVVGQEKKYKCNAYTSIYFADVREIKITEKFCSNNKKCYTTSMVGKSFFEKGYVAVKEKKEFNRRYRNEVILFDDSEEDNQGKALVFGNDSLLKHNFLEAAKALNDFIKKKREDLKAIYEAGVAPSLSDIVLMLEQNKSNKEIGKKLAQKYLSNILISFTEFNFDNIEESTKNESLFIYKNKNGNMVACAVHYITSSNKPAIYFYSNDKPYLEELGNEKSEILTKYKFVKTNKTDWWSVVVTEK
jgi:hypothetical protein